MLFSKQVWVILFVVGFSIRLVAQTDMIVKTKAETQNERPISLTISGFVKTDYWLDSRSVVAAREDLFLLFPADIQHDASGNDINGDPVFNFSAITSRVASHIEGPEAFGARTTGLIEADFSGVTNADINGFRLRHAYVKLKWEQFDLLLGQWWHPMFGIGAVPTVVSLNTGAPFQPFIRNPQASLTFKKGALQTLFALIAQRDNASDGPKGVSPDYLKNAALPNLHLQFIYNKNNITLGFATDYKWIRPLKVTPLNHKTHETLGTFAFMGYIRHNPGLWDVKAKAIYGQNLSEHLLLGGYAEQFIDPQTGRTTYTPLNHAMGWVNILYGNKYKTGLFAGYTKNFGSHNIITGDYYGRGKNINWLYRIAPSFIITSGAIKLCTEVEYTAAAFGEPNQWGKVSHEREVGNFRLLFTALYFF